ncbi:MAG: GNAT family N-acetyltransferase [Pseudomonadota bacterium]
MIHIRLATPVDVPAIRSCAEAAYSQYIASIGRPPAPMLAPFEKQVDRGETYVAEDHADHFLGYITFQIRDRVVSLESIAVRQPGQGIGKQLITFCEAAAKAGGAKAVTLYTNEKMTANLTLYPHLGYVEIARRTDEGFNRVYFEKVLAP